MLYSQGGDGLLESMKATSRNIGLLNLARQRMNEDRNDKIAGRQVSHKAAELFPNKSNFGLVT